jgi:hypothetical protein
MKAIEQYEFSFYDTAITAFQASLTFRAILKLRNNGQLENRVSVIIIA